MCAAVIRIFGLTLVELPLVATRLSARRQVREVVFNLLDRRWGTHTHVK